MRKPDFRVWDIEKKRMIFFNAFEACGYIDHTKSDTALSMGSRELLISTNPEKFAWQEFTGLKDKAGNKIYEGDIVQTNHISKGTIAWSKMASQWWIEFHDDVSYRKKYRELVPDYGDDQLYCQYVEVIGHCYEPGQKTEA